MLSHWWLPQWVPFAGHVATDALIVDQRDGPDQGRVGQFRHDDHTVDLGASLT